MHKNKKKMLFPFVLFERENNIDFSGFELKCNSNVPEDIGGFPEMDGYRWLTIDEARSHLYPTQVECLDEIEKLIKK
jgi:predicted NUDIX family NTP pyrophosphohydrolase